MIIKVFGRRKLLPQNKEQNLHQVLIHFWTWEPIFDWNIDQLGIKMSSSFIARSLQSSSYKGREPISTSPTRKPLSSSTSSPQKDLEMAATRRNPVQRSESLSRYDVGTSSRRSTRKLRENISSPHPTATRASPKTNNGLPTRRLSGVILSPNVISILTSKLTIPSSRKLSLLGWFFYSFLVFTDLSFQRLVHGFGRHHCHKLIHTHMFGLGHGTKGTLKL